MFFNYAELKNIRAIESVLIGIFGLSLTAENILE